jgi:hypothetical protein
VIGGFHPGGSTQSVEGLAGSCTTSPAGRGDRESLRRRRSRPRRPRDLDWRR